MTKRTRQVLLTGFGPFPSVPVNATAALSGAIAARARLQFSDLAIEQATLPADWTEAPAALERHIDRCRPDLVLHFGVSASARGFVIEMTGRNQTKAAVDVAGNLPRASELLQGGPAFVTAGPGGRRIVEHLRREGYPARLSHDAGSYLCNAVYYHSLWSAQRTSPSRQVFFVHLPIEPAAIRRESAGWREVSPERGGAAVSGGLEILSLLLSPEYRAQSRRRPQRDMAAWG